MLNAFCSDGASVMTGKTNGVGKLLTEDNPLLIKVHCVAHKSSLAAKDSMNKDDQFSIIEALINELYSFFNTPLRTTILHAFQRQLYTNKTIELHQSIDSRWLKRFLAFRAVRSSYGAIILALASDDLRGEAGAKRMLEKLQQYSTMILLNGFLDILFELYTINLAFQSDDLTFNEPQAAVKDCIDSLKRKFLLTDEITRSTVASASDISDDTLDMDRDVESVDAVREVHNIGPNPIRSHSTDIGNLAFSHGQLDLEYCTFFASFYEDERFERIKEGTRQRPSDMAPTITKIYLKGQDNIDRGAFIIVRQLARDVVASLINRFEDLHKLDFFRVLCPTDVRKMKENPACNIDVLNMRLLAKYFDVDDIPEVKALLKRAQQLMQTFTGGFTAFWQFMSIERMATMEVLVKLAAKALVVPMNSACAERGFAAVCGIKTKIRNKMHTTTLNQVMFIHLEGREISLWDHDEAYQAWLTSKTRRNV